MVNLNSNFYKSWQKILKKNKNKIIQSKLIGKISRGINEEKLSLIDTIVKTKNNEKLNRALILEPPSVVVVPVLKLKKTKKFILVKQFRISQGKEILEFPAGAVNNNDIIKSALEEIREEINIEINKQDLKPLYPKPIMMTPSYNSSLAYFFYFEKKTNEKILNKINNSVSGLKKFGERIKIKIVGYKEIVKISSSSVVIGISLYNRLKK